MVTLTQILFEIQLEYLNVFVFAEPILNIEVEVRAIADSLLLDDPELRLRPLLLGLFLAGLLADGKAALACLLPVDRLLFRGFDLELIEFRELDALTSVAMHSFGW